MIDIGLRLSLSRVTVAPVELCFRFVWDDENPDWNYKCRTQHPEWTRPQITAPPAVIRYYPEPRERSGDYRVNLASPYDWEPCIVALNGYDQQKFDYWTGSTLAQFNQTGWPKFAYVGMCGNYIDIIERVSGWVKFKTLKQSDLDRARSLTPADKTLIHGFHCVKWKDGETVRIYSTGTPRGEVWYPLVTNEGYAWIPERHVIQESN